MFSRPYWFTKPTWVAVVIGVVCLLLLASQTRRTSSPTEPPIADLSSPESALHSYWVLRDWARRYQTKAPKPEGAPLTVGEVMSVVTAGGTRESYQTRPGGADQFEWSIERVQQTSPNHAVATARIRNLTLNPAPITPTPVELFAPEVGLRFRYVLLKDDAGWKVSEVWRIEQDGKSNRIR